MKNLIKLIVMSVALAASSLLVPSLIQPVWIASATAAEQANEQTQSFLIEKMTCAACPITVKKAMTRVAGVKDVSIDFDSKIAVAVFDPAVTNAEEIAASSTNVGYPATIIDD